MDNRRSFVKKTALGVAGVSMAVSAKSYSRIWGANERLNAAVMGTRSRGSALMNNFMDADNVLLSHIIDVDKNVLERSISSAEKKQGTKPKGSDDVRKVLQDKDLDILVIAAPDHWHAPASLMAMKADKHVYVEKPCSHNPAEGEILIEAQKKFGKVIQMGNQQRSGLHTIKAISDIKDGLIGKPYLGKAWYANKRGPIGTGKKVPVPSHLNYELWQGPAPRADYQDNLIHYNWHWFWNWGTGEICNNGTHEIDICRWALGVDYPTLVSSNGGRYHYQDDWEFYDTQIASFDFEDGKTISWEGRSCNNLPDEGWGRGVSIHGTEGSVLIDRNVYKLFDKNSKLVKEETAATISSTMDTVGAGGGLTDNHVANMLNAIRKGEEQASPIHEGHKSVLLCHLGNIAQKMGRSLNTDPNNGKILGDKEALKMWGRKYEKGWEMTL